jgi:hypothetical protein
MNTIAQRLALYFTLGMVLVSLDVTFFSWQFWAVLALFWVSEFIVRKGTEDQARAEGVSIFLNLTSAEQNKIKQIHQQIQKERDNG